jgi:hypothetical protein
MLYSTAARAEEVLRLNAENLDRANRHARTIRKGVIAGVDSWCRPRTRPHGPLPLPRANAATPSGVPIPVGPL